MPFPEPHPASVDLEVGERVDADGGVVRADDVAAVATIRALAERQVEAVAVCLSVDRQPTHELRVGELLDAHLPVFPTRLASAQPGRKREYRRVVGRDDASPSPDAGSPGRPRERPA
ncbi:hypothetical protein HBB16_04905 [Pseudonocardia sp. MCCB 268]|nr:hypothetical protein [Pseudonocardia cytotoxica]